jgi:hypothetical protein
MLQLVRVRHSTYGDDPMKAAASHGPSRHIKSGGRTGAATTPGSRTRFGSQDQAGFHHEAIAVVVVARIYDLEDIDHKSISLSAVTVTAATVTASLTGQ